ncbi:MAG: response regulator [Sphaerospermopsis sp. SIO1G1]|nr:response regulator [Sphaerospermopsis sp. SIO1G1]
MKNNLKVLYIDITKVEGKATYLTWQKADTPVDIHLAKSLNQGLCQLKQEKFDCVFLDCCLKNPDSLTLTHKLNSLEKKIPLVILTIPKQKEIAEKLIKIGATEYFFKSEISPTNLPMILRQVQHLHQAKMEVELAYRKIDIQKQELETQKLQLETASKLKSQFITTISHEIRTPMNAIIGFSQLLLRPKFGPLTSQQTDMLERILKNGKHLLNLINEVLDFAKLESGNIAIKSETFDIAKIINNTVTQIHSSAKCKNLSLSVDINLENTLILNDPVRVHQILINLLSNAIKFTEFGSIGLEVKEQTKDIITIAIHDTGIGIAPQNLQNIFEAFRQVDQKINRQYSGTGLGLAITDSLVRKMGGKILLQSQLGVGSKFQIDIPRYINLSPDSNNYYPTSVIGRYQTYNSLTTTQTELNCTVTNPASSSIITKTKSPNK